MIESSESGLSIGGRIDALCDRFEAERRGRGEPKIEEYLEQVDPSHQSYLLGELLFLDLEYRRRADERPTLEEYRSRFPEYEEIIAKVFADFIGWSSARIRKMKGSSWSARMSSRMRRSGGAASRMGEEAPEAPGGPLVPRVLGNYVLLDIIGKGAMGVVYRALQRNVGRLVALKLIRPDVLSDLSGDQKKELIERFHTETMAAARLEHDHIVTVYEVDEANGYYYYSMQYIEGESLAELCGDYPLDSRRAAELLSPVARAVHEAHTHNILHRDLKPRNILVDLRTGRALVADFGLAKLQETGPNMTTTGDMIGSPAYMSPEQAIDSANVTSATDVYGLGATLYHLLTAKPPFQTAAVVMTIGQVVFDDPVPPRRLNPLVDQDIETICLKCLEKDPQRRYGSAEELADDLDRYLRGEPIRARPVGPWGRMGRWCRRKPMVAGLIGLAAAFLLTAVGVGCVGYLQTKAALGRERQAKVQAWRDRDAAKKARKNEADRADEARRNLNMARQAVDVLQDQVSEDPRLKVHGLESLRRELLDSARSFYDIFVQQKGEDAGFREGQGRAYGRLAAITAELGSTDDAIQLFKKAQQIFEELAIEHPDSPEFQNQRAEYLSKMGTLYAEVGQLADAERMYQEAYQICEGLVRDHPNDARYHASLAANSDKIALLHQKMALLEAAEWDWQAAIDFWIDALRFDSDNAEYLDGLAECHNSLALLYSQSSRYAEAKTHSLQALQIWEQLARDHRGIPRYLQALAKCHCNLALLHQRLDQKEDAENHYRAASTIREQLTREHPDVPAYANELAASQLHIGRLYQETDREADAEASYRDAVRICENLVNYYPDVTDYRANLAAAENALGVLLRDSGRGKEAEPSFQQALANFETLASRNREVPSYQTQLAAAYQNLGDLYRAEKRFDEAEGSYRAALLVRQQFAEENPSESTRSEAIAAAKTALALNEADRADYAASQGKLDQALDSCNKALAALEPLVDSAADQQQVHALLSRVLIARSRVNERLKKYADAVASWDQAVQLETGAQRNCVRLQRAASVARLGQYQDAVQEADKLRDAIAGQPELLYDAARVYACAAPAAAHDPSLPTDQRRRLEDQYAEQAVKLLEQARQAGLFHAQPRLGQLTADHDLDPLRKRPDFQSLVRRAAEEARGPKTPPPAPPSSK